MADARQLAPYAVESAPKAHVDLPAAALVEEAIRRGEAILAANGALAATTGVYTGRSPKDKFTVRHPDSRLAIHWGPINQPFDPAAFDALHRRVLDHLKANEHYVFHGFCGADPRYRLRIRVVTELAWHNLFARQLFIRPTAAELEGFEPEVTVLSAPSVKADPARDGTRSEAFVLMDYDRGLIVIGGTEYAGEIKKSVFSFMNARLPGVGVLPMHCSANVSQAGDVALFFGLSGTGKTTLSADPERRLIGDDEHAWSDDGIFNLEGGCYAKCIHLSAEKEPQIWDAIRFGTVLENVIVNPLTRETDYDDDALTENTRAAYPVEYIPGAVIPGVAGHPSTILFLTADASGVLPPISRLDENQAMYHFLSGFTSKLAGTERGVTTPQATFSTCFGEPFLPLSPVVYAELLGERIRRHKVRVFLVNTGWTGGPYGVGQRMDLAETRRLVRAALAGQLDAVPYRRDPTFGLEVPTVCPGVRSEILDPRSTWADPAAYDEAARDLARRFRENFARFEDVPAHIRDAGPVA